VFINTVFLNRACFVWDSLNAQGRALVQTLLLLFDFLWFSTVLTVARPKLWKEETSQTLQGRILLFLHTAGMLPSIPVALPEDFLGIPARLSRRNASEMLLGCLGNAREQPGRVPVQPRGAKMIRSGLAVSLKSAPYKQSSRVIEFFNTANATRPIVLRMCGTSKMR
jgi:hypothetical protein